MNVTGTGKIVNSQQKTQAFYFDCADGDVNFSDGTYVTDCVFNNNSFITAAYIRFNQDLSAYPPFVVRILTTGTYGLIIETATIPQANIVNGFAPCTTVPLANVVGGGTNTNNVQALVRLIGITGSGITALTFTVVFDYIELDF